MSDPKVEKEEEATGEEEMSTASPEAVEDEQAIEQLEIAETEGLTEDDDEDQPQDDDEDYEPDDYEPTDEEAEELAEEDEDDGPEAA